MEINIEWLNRIDTKTLIAIEAALEAGKEILSIYQSENYEIQFKNNNSPLTLADKVSHEIISKHLSKTKYNILSEEGSNIEYSIRKNWKNYWLIDPIDGTKEFINKNGEFTVNIALIDNQTPILGVVYVPCYKTLYFANKDLGSFKIENIKEFDDIQKSKFIDLKKSVNPKTYTTVVSKSHMNNETKKYVETLQKKHGNINIKSYGSSLKICKVAERKANCYPRFGPTMEWDTAAAHAIAKFSNCNIIIPNSKSTLVYNKQNLLNPYFIISNE